MTRCLVVGLGNIGDEYANTRHNIGFLVLEAFAKKAEASFSSGRYGDVAECSFKGTSFTLLKPSTFVNLSGKAVNYWMQQKKILGDRLLVVADDLALPFGTLRMKANGSDGGHNGLKSVAEILGHVNYPRLRFGIGSNFPKGVQVDYVLGEWTTEEQTALPERIGKAVEMIQTFGREGVQISMNRYNNK